MLRPFSRFLRRVGQPFFLVALLGTILWPSWVHALTFTPERIDIEGEAGARLADELILLNESAEPITVSLSPTPMVVLDAEQGQATFDLNADPLEWITVEPSQFVLQTGEQRSVAVRMDVPQEVTGSLFAGIAARYLPVTPEGGSGIRTQAVTGPLVFIEVLAEGSVREGFITQVVANNGSRWFSHGPVPVEVSFANTGNVHLQPKGQVEFRDIFGRLLATLPLNQEGKTVLPGATRRFEVSWGTAAEERISGFASELRQPLFGPMYGEVVMNYGTSEDVARVTLMAVPWRLALALGLLLIGVAIARRRLRRV